MEQKVVYFDSPGRHNTEMALHLARERAEAKGLRSLVFSSTRGYTAELAMKLGADLNLVAVGEHRTDFDVATAEKFREVGKLVFCHEIDYRYPPDMQRAFRSFGEGTKVAVEVVVCATKEGLVQEGELVVALGGTDVGVDTALVVKAAADFAQVWISEVVCKPA